MFIESFSQRWFYILQVKYDLLFLLAGQIFVWDKKSVIFLFVLSFPAFCWCLHSKYASFVCFLCVVLRWQNIATQTAGADWQTHSVSALFLYTCLFIVCLCLVFTQVCSCHRPSNYSILLLHLGRWFKYRLHCTENYNSYNHKQSLEDWTRAVWRHVLSAQREPHLTGAVEQLAENCASTVSCFLFVSRCAVSKSAERTHVGLFVSVTCSYITR